MTYKKKGHWRSCPTPGCGRRIYWDHGQKPKELIYKKKLYCCERHRNGAENVERWHDQRKKRQKELLKGKKEGTSQQIVSASVQPINSHSNLGDMLKDLKGTARKNPFVLRRKIPEGTFICRGCKKRSAQVTNLDLVHGGLCPSCYNKRGDDHDK